MAGFNNIIGHEELSGNLKNAMKTGKVPILIFLPEARIRKKTSCNNLCDDASV